MGACSQGGGNQVSMVPGRRFDPVTARIAAGDTVTWESKSDDVHTVTAYQDSLPTAADYFSSGGFSSEAEAREDLPGALIKNGETYEVTFDEPGTYEYFCIPHESEGMRGKIVVEP